MGELRDRGTGVLMHISSLPGKYGVGDLGSSAREFAGMLSGAGVSAWQMLPLVPTSGAFAHSPYSSPSAFAGNIMYISPDKLAEEGLIDASELVEHVAPDSTSADFARAYDIKRAILKACYKNFRDGEAYRTTFRDMSDKFWDFCFEEAYWLEDYALYSVLKDMEGGMEWSGWRRDFRVRNWDALDPLKAKPEIASALDERRFEQFLFFRQLGELRDVCKELGVSLIGDLPIYVAYDSADVWGHQDLFDLDDEGRPISVAGVPPDYFSATGQRWGNPIYRWDRMRRDGYFWWLGRCRHALRQADRVRIDHFRGLLAFWDIPVSEPTAENGYWKAGPGSDLLSAMKHCFADGASGTMPFIAEDLGVRTDDVIQAMEDFGMPGMKVLQFAFGQGMSENPYIPHNHRRNCVVYSGTHDNDTSAGWWSASATEEERENFKKYMDLKNMDEREAADAMVRCALSSTADLAVITVQDILRLGAGARMNTPSTVEGNWVWKLENLADLKKEMARVGELSSLFGRSALKGDRQSGGRPAGNLF
ncbi:MAG: 4-alpha-glucanotransferase [Synergistaceae bacterium]|jgi:4-alpha-glucanotransferase|nr:4-alpha-glucanotransferase [Synergistaceae bacterium]